MCHDGDVYIHEITTDFLLFGEMECCAFQTYYAWYEGRFCTCWYLTSLRNWMRIGKGTVFYVFQFSVTAYNRQFIMTVCAEE